MALCADDPEAGVTLVPFQAGLFSVFSFVLIPKAFARNSFMFIKYINAYFGLGDREAQSWTGRDSVHCRFRAAAVNPNVGPAQMQPTFPASELYPPPLGGP